MFDKYLPTEKLPKFGLMSVEQRSKFLLSQSPSNAKGARPLLAARMSNHGSAVDVVCETREVKQEQIETQMEECSTV